MNLKQYLMWFKGTYSYNASFILVFDKSTDLLLSQILITQYRLKHSIGADLIFFMLISMVYEGTLYKSDEENALSDLDCLKISSC